MGMFDDIPRDPIYRRPRTLDGILQRPYLVGPSSALNDVFTRPADRVRNMDVGRPADYQGQQTGALSDLYIQQAGQSTANADTSPAPEMVAANPKIDDVEADFERRKKELGLMMSKEGYSGPRWALPPR